MPLIVNSLSFFGTTCTGKNFNQIANGEEQKKLKMFKLGKMIYILIFLFRLSADMFSLSGSASDARPGSVVFSVVASPGVQERGGHLRSERFPGRRGGVDDFTLADLKARRRSYTKRPGF